MVIIKTGIQYVMITIFFILVMAAIIFFGMGLLIDSIPEDSFFLGMSFIFAMVAGLMFMFSKTFEYGTKEEHFPAQVIQVDGLFIVKCGDVVETSRDVRFLNKTQTTMTWVHKYNRWGDEFNSSTRIDY